VERSNPFLSFRDGASAPDLKCAIAHRGISCHDFEIPDRRFAPSGMTGVGWIASLALAIVTPEVAK
jgi:hypothetical protein